MIKASELRLGNKIILCGKDYNHDNVFRDSAADEIITVGIDGLKLVMEHGEDYEGTPLTPEILEKWNNIEFYIATSSGITLMIKDGKLVWYDNEWDEYTRVENVTYVHQFQNLYFALTGEELEINL